MRASEAKRATRSERAGEAARESACRGVRGAKPLGSNVTFRDTIGLALRNLGQAKLRTALTTLGVSIGIASLAGMVSLGVGLQDQFVERFTRSGMFDAGFLKLRTVAASYELPRSLTSWIGASRGSFTLSGENLAILWRAQKDAFGVEWIDPEINPNRSFDGTGNYTYTQESWPQLMRIRGTIRLTF